MLLPLRAGMIALVSAFAALVLAGWLLPLPEPFATWTKPIILEFLFGIGLAALYLSGVRLSGFVRLGLVAAGVALMMAGEAAGLRGEVGRWLLWGVPAALIAAGFILGPDFAVTRFTQALRLGGDASYSLYLSHLFSLRAIGLVWPMLGVTNGWAFIAVAGAGSIIAAVLIYLLVEKPMLRLLRTLGGAGRPRAAPRLHNA
jgi:peptidoglycan/LPS O-acetylase OafA/YrhL